MRKDFRTPMPFAIWLILIACTLASFGIFERRLLGPLSTLVIVTIAAVKARLVLRHFMEAAQAPGKWRFLYETWIFVAAAIIVIGHYVALMRVT